MCCYTIIPGLHDYPHLLKHPEFNISQSEEDIMPRTSSEDSVLFFLRSKVDWVPIICQKPSKTVTLLNLVFKLNIQLNPVQSRLKTKHFDHFEFQVHDVLAL